MTYILNNEDIHRYLSLFILFISLPMYFTLTRKITAPFGKHTPLKSTTTNKNTTGQTKNTNTISNDAHKWGALVNPKIAWFLFESPNLVWSYYAYQNRQIQVFDTSIANRTLFALFVIHYVNRCIIYPLKMKKSSTPVNLAILSSAFFFCSINGFLQAQNYCQFQSYYNTYHTNLNFILGLLLWIIGFIINIQSDSILRDLRKDNDKSYKIPRGGCFHYVSCANFFGEILEWFGYAIASSSIAAWAFWFFVLGNLLPRGIAHHQWYLKKFQEEYPKDRCAVIPFIL